MVIPDALKVLRLQHGHRFCQLGPLATSVGWKHEEAVKALEAKRKVKVRGEGRQAYWGAGGGGVSAAARGDAARAPPSATLTPCFPRPPAA